MHLLLPPIDLLDQNLVGASSPQADLKPALIVFSLLLCMKYKRKPMKTYAPLMGCNRETPRHTVHERVAVLTAVLLMCC
jgi:hypothetical protein